MQMACPDSFFPVPLKLVPFVRQTEDDVAGDVGGALAVGLLGQGSILYFSL